MENNGPFNGADRTREEASEVPLIVNDHNVIDDWLDTNNSQLSQFQQENNSTYTPPGVSLDLTEFLLFRPRPGPNSLAVIEDDAPNDSRETDFSGDGSTRNIINTETKDVEEKVTEGDANELETQIDSESVKENEIGTNTVILDSDVPTSNWLPGDPRPSTSSPNSMPRHNSFKSTTTNNSNSRSAQDKPYPCDLCDKSYTRKYDRTQHMLTHTGKGPYPCDLCNKSYTRKSDRTRHMFTHTGNKPYPCQLCDKSFARKYDHTLHMLTHTKNKLKKTCPECGQKFSTFEEMINHRLIHTIQKPYKCQLCEYATHRQDGLSSHMKTHSTDRVPSSSSEARPTRPGSSRASPATRPASNHSNEQQLRDQIPAEPVRQEQPEAAQARVELAGNETILPRDQIAPQEGKDERSPPDHDGETIAPRYHPNL